MLQKEKHKLIQEYIEHKELYSDYAELVASLLKSFLTSVGIPYYTIEHRGKTVESLREKIQRKKVQGKEYSDIQEVTDLAGIRVILFFSDDVERVRDIVHREFKNIVLEEEYELQLQKRKSEVGYTAQHEFVKMIPKRARLSEYKRFRSLICEIQIKSVLQHAWAEIEHDIGYKPKVKETDLERSQIRALFKKNAQLLQKVDENFVEIRERHIALLAEYTTEVERHKLKVLSVNFDTVRAYLRKTLGQQHLSKNVVLKAVETARLNNIQNIYELEKYFEKKGYIEDL